MKFIKTPKFKYLVSNGRHDLFISFLPRYSFSQINFHKNQEFKLFWGSSNPNIYQNLESLIFHLGFSHSILQGKKFIKLLKINKKGRVGSQIM